MLQSSSKSEGFAMFRHILVATDGSDLAGRAVDTALSLAKDIGARVTAVNVTELWSATEMTSKAGRFDKHPVEEYEARAQSSAQKILTVVRDRAEAAGVKCQTLHIADKRPAEGIVAAAEEQGCDVIVMATHGRRGLQRLVLGSQASEVITLSKMPVLICP
jgi:nucleotide-binding universal stress UspA family protein